MGLTAISGALIGTSESSLSSTIATTASLTGSEIDMFGSGTPIVGVVNLYAVITSTVTAGTVDFYFAKQRVTGAAYMPTNPQFSVAPINGTQKVPLGQVSIPRYCTGKVLNNATGANCTVFFGYEGWVDS